MKGIIAAMGVVVLATVAPSGCATTSGTITPTTNGSGTGSCAAPTLREADGQGLTVGPGDTVTLIAQDVVDYACPDRSPGASAGQPATPAQFDVLWSQSGASTEVSEIVSDGEPVEFEFSVPNDATPGVATVTVGEASLELEVTR